MPIAISHGAESVQLTLAGTRRSRAVVLVLVGLVVATVVSVVLFRIGRHGHGAETRLGGAYVADDFNRSDRNILGDEVSGTRYKVQFDPGSTQLWIRHGRLVRGNPRNSGAKGGPILIFSDSVVPSVVAVEYVFTTGRTMADNVVVGTCAESFGQSSVQFAVSPRGWRLLYTLKRPGSGGGTAIVPLATGTFSAPLVTDGRTRYRTTMRVDLTHSAVTVEFPGAAQTFTDPAIAKYWGRLMGIQIRHPLPTDGDAEITAIASGPATLRPFARKS